MTAKTSNRSRLSGVEEAWNKFETSWSENRPSRLPSNSPSFVEYAWKKFDPKIVIDLLTSSEHSYEAHKSILFAGFCTWSVCPSRLRLIQHGMMLAAIREICWAEALGRGTFPKHPILGDTVGRLTKLGPDFYSDFYYPIGGLQTLLGSTTPRNFANSVKKASQDIPWIVTMMQIFDFHSKNLSDKQQYYEASLTKCTELLSTIYSGRGITGGNKDNAKKRWTAEHHLASITYAASTIAVNDQENLLDVIRAGEASFEEHGGLLGTWLARAAYASETILAGVPKTPYAKTNANNLPMVDPEPTPEPDFTETEKGEIIAAFDKQAILQGRAKTERSRSARRRN